MHLFELLRMIIFGPRSISSPASAVQLSRQLGEMTMRLFKFEAVIRMPLRTRCCRVLASAMFLIAMPMAAPPVQAAGECAAITNLEQRLVCIEKKVDALTPAPVFTAPPAVISVTPPASTCGSGQTSCGGVCTDTATNFSNCGGCGRSCRSGETCMAGNCTCPPGRMCR